MSKLTAQRLGKKGGSRAGDRPLTWRTDQQDPRSGQCSRHKPIAFILTPGNVADISAAAALLDDIVPPHRLLGDKAYDADHLRQRLERQGTEVVIPSTASRRRPYPLNRTAYKRRNVIERMFCRMKDWRRIATRYDRLARNFLSAIALVATACFWLT